VARNDLCIYCGKTVRPSRKGKGEHVVPSALGGAATISSVCVECNNGVLSDLDRELVAKSPVAFIAAQELGNRIEYAWDVDHAQQHLLLEGHPNDSFDAMVLWPQIIFHRNGPLFYCDSEDFKELGTSECQKRFLAHLNAAFRSVWNVAKKKRIFFEKTAVESSYSFPPRIFAAHSIMDFNGRITFQCRYLNATDRKRALGMRDLLTSDRRFRKFGWQRGSQYPAFAMHFDPMKILRALTKTGINLVAWIAKRTEVNRQTFEAAVKFVRGERSGNPSLLRDSGFVYAADLALLECPPGAHKFRLIHDSGKWTLFCAFFSGRVGAVMDFPGPSDEPWRTIDILTPLKSKEWVVAPSSLLRPIIRRVEWKDFGKIIPSIPFCRSQTELSVQRNMASKEPAS